MLDGYLYLPLRECEFWELKDVPTQWHTTQSILYRTWLTPLLVTEYVTEMVALNTRNSEKGRLNILLRRRRYLAHITST